MAASRKGERSRATRARIVDAATRLFSDNGYLDTTMAAIASEAGVAVQTLYLSFGSKGAILKAAHDVAVVGDDEPVPVLERQWVADLRAERDGRRALALLVANSHEILMRVAPVYGVIQSAAAEPDVAALLHEIKAAHLLTIRGMIGELASKPGFAPGLSADRAAEIVYTVLSDAVYRLLVLECKWSVDAWKEWTEQTLTAQLFPAQPRKRVPR